MMDIKLQSRSGEKVVDFDAKTNNYAKLIYSMIHPPEVVTWGARVFTLYLDQGDALIYREAFAMMLDGEFKP